MQAERAIDTLRAWLADERCHLTAQQFADALAMVEQPLRPAQADLLMGTGSEEHERHCGSRASAD